MRMKKGILIMARKGRDRETKWDRERVRERKLVECDGGGEKYGGVRARWRGEKIYFFYYHFLLSTLGYAAFSHFGTEWLVNPRLKLNNTGMFDFYCLN